MSARQSRIAWGTVLGTVGCICLGLSIGQAQPQASPPPASLLPANSVLYVGFDGNETHKAAWEQTAAYQSLYETGLMDVVKKVFDFAVDQAQREAGGEGAAEFGQFKQVYDLVSEKGFSLGVSVAAGQGPPTVQATLVLHEAAALAGGLQKLAQQAAQDQQVPFETKEVAGRQVTSTIIPNTPGVELGWWTEGNHLVVVAGLQAVETITAVANGDAPNITTNQLWNKYRGGQADFEVTMVSWFDMGTLRGMFGQMPIPSPAGPDQMLTVDQILQTLGLDTVGAIACRSGYKGRAIWSETTVEAPGEKKGLLALADQEAISMEDLPPLPFGTNGFHACSLNWVKMYDDLAQLARDAAALGPPDAAAQVEGLLDNLPAIIGFDLRNDLFDALGNVVCLYGDTRQSMLGMGFGLVFEVKDADKLRATLNQLVAMAGAQAPPDQLSVQRSQKQGREIVTLSMAKGVINPAFAVDDKWFAVGLLPQSVEAFLLRLDGKLTNWTPSRTYREGFAELPAEFTSITASDPRKTYRLLMGLAPMLLSGIRMGMQEAGLPDIEVPVTVADLPPAEQVARPLFPNIAVCTVDDNGIHWTSRSSLPSIPLLGGMQSAATAPILVALLLPAVQAAREAARRTQSMNNLKQIGLALHNYADVNRNFPPGTATNDALKPEQRLSWLVEVLPYLDQAALFQQIDRTKGWQDDANQRGMQQSIAAFQNPGIGETGGEYPSTHYVGIAGLGQEGPTLPVDNPKAGIFAYDRVTRFADIRDGTSNTVMVSEAGEKHGPWGSGGSATIRPLTQKPYINGPDGIGGPFQGGCNMLFGDGAVRFISENIDPGVMEALTTINGQEQVPNF